jgi:CheY-like chemotaxis protein
MNEPHNRLIACGAVYRKLVPYVRRTSLIGSYMSRVLIVDDDPFLRNLLAATLPRHELHFADDGASALELAATEQLDLIVLDVWIPRIPGTVVCQLLKQAPATQHIPVLILTGDHDRELPRHCLAAGADGFLTKPFSPIDFLTECARLLETRPPLAA